MKKFVLLYVGHQTITHEIREAWGNWFASIAAHVVDSGNPFGAGREISPEGTRELPLGSESLTGYTLIHADSLDAAERIAQTCPIVSGVRVYEALSM